MRTWRVGSISMGASLLLLGLLLLFTQLFHIEASLALLTWWPIILVILGVEILLYLLFSKQEKPNVKYDLLSILFVGIIGMAGIGFTIFTATGVLDKFNDWTTMELKTMDLPEYENDIGKDIKRVVVDEAWQGVRIEDTKNEVVSIFGTYHAQTLEDKKPITSVQDYLLIKEVGDTLYVQFKPVHTLSQPFQDRVDMNATLVVPSDLKVEVISEHNDSIVSVKQ
ncbi:hypothetical protein [Virgibacillus sp. DJP39]|uniref:hypothetical protein n=1 Tax=Virgibacillus sp. DJP39 TaxID=3409790 RepID=UPI003BB7DD15